MPLLPDSFLSNLIRPLKNVADNEQHTAEKEAPVSEEARSEDTLSEEVSRTEGRADKAGGGSAPPEEGDDEPKTEADALRAELAELRAEQEATNDRLLRTAAELQNVRRRAAEEQRRRAVQARSAALRPMLEVLDDLQRALDAAADAGSDPGSSPSQQEGAAAFQSLHSGVQMVERKFEDALKGLGVEPIEAEGRSFDEALHEAMMRQPAPEGVAPGTVLAEIRRGYRLDAGDEERVLRHSRVVVAAEPEQASAEEDSEENESAEE